MLTCKHRGRNLISDTQFTLTSERLPLHYKYPHTISRVCSLLNRVCLSHSELLCLYSTSNPSIFIQLLKLCLVIPGWRLDSYINTRTMPSLNVGESLFLTLSFPWRQTFYRETYWHVYDLLALLLRMSCDLTG